ncbi:juvenile hormone esterase-like isoform X2 [Leguminivora glycinivorella]|uniref:juvenile hormone esterase-like isoform X2 n=1 Tax=Leguminivora glycinivorella TaxID=1035111 RepID=UPI00200F42B3|nr:juvenile hormone esterase-like isoform X2 [Leguminivora glycinivorella]
MGCLNILIMSLLLGLDLCVIGINARSRAHVGYVQERLTGDMRCNVPAQTMAGAVCGALRGSYYGHTYASFRGVPYARQPLGHLRFVAPQPVDPWDGFFNASVEGPVCPQSDVLYGPMMQPLATDEDCLHVNVHAPVHHLPAWGRQCCGSTCLPVLVFIHGGAFHSGSGDGDLNGPEYMIDENVVVVTFNHRLGPFGFLSLNSSSVPGNTGLRDMLAALRWVQDNIRAFGGDPHRVTLMGQSAGASEAHMLSLSECSEGLFQRLILMSGTAGSGFFTTRPSYAQNVKESFLKVLGINSTDADEIHRQLVALPAQALVDANSVLLASSGFVVFSPVVESQFNGVKRILDNDPDVLVGLGRGSQYTTLLGFTNNECASFRHRLDEVDIIGTIKKNPITILPAKLMYSVSPARQAVDAQKMMDRYFDGNPSMEDYIPACSDSFFIYPTLKLAKARSMIGAPLYLYKFSFSSSFVPVKRAFGIDYGGAGHMDDLSYVLRVNSMLKDTMLNPRDEEMKDWMTRIVAKFVVCGMNVFAAT